MYSSHLHLATALLLGFALWLVAAPASAWLETSVRSHVATVDVDRRGAAVVTHELTLRVRGGPLKSLSLAGIDADAAPLPDATVTRVRRDTTTTWPLLLQPGDDGSLAIEVDDDKGLGSGTYLFTFRYRTDLMARGYLRPRGSLVDLRWIGPRLEDGVDSARVIFRLPSGDAPPTLANGASEGSAGTMLADVLVTELRRAPDKDELELVRPHLAKGEPAVWNAWVSAKAFDVARPEAVAPRPAPIRAADAAPGRRLLLLLGALIAALGYGLLLTAKWLVVKAGARLRHAAPRALVPLPVALRAALAGVAMAAAVFVGAQTRHPTWAGALLVLAMVLAVHVGARPEARLRGPGAWRVVPDDAFAARPEPALPGAWLDAGSWPGFVVFTLLLGGFVAGALRLLPGEPYYALLVALGSACLLPIFFTGRRSELPADPVVDAARPLRRIASRLRRAGLEVKPYQRFAAGETRPDEFRLLVEAPRAVPGLTALELAVEFQHGISGSVASPCVVVRAIDDSEAVHALPHGVVWTRGRSPDERVAVIRPKLPTVAFGAALTQRIVALLAARRAPAQSARAATRARRSSGKPISTSKRAMPAASAAM